MCTFVTAALPKGADVVAIRTALGDPNSVLRPIDNRNILSRLEPGSTYFRALESWCDCGVALGCRASYGARPHDTPHELAKLRKKGWGEAKITRWLEAREKLASQRERKAEAWARGEVRWWHELIQTALGKGQAKWFALLLHFYNAPLEQEDIVWSREERLELPVVTDEVLLHLEHDVLYRFQLPHQRRG